MEINALENGNYLSYILGKKVLEGSSANSVLTVGSISGKDIINNLDPGLNPAQIRFFTEKQDPAPNTRTGNGLGNAIKPDLCAIGGNLVFFPERVPNVRSINSTSIIGPNIDFINSNLFCLDVGTCLAACVVGNLCARLKYWYPDHTGNFYRAMLGNRFSKIPLSGELSRNPAVVQDKTEMRKILGYGTILEKSLFYGNPRKITIFSENELGLNDFHIFEVPIPDSFKNENGNRTVIVTLAYNPYVVYRKEYRAVKMEFKYYYDEISKEDVINDNNKLNNRGRNQSIRAESNNLFNVDPSSTERNNSTLQTAHYFWKRFTTRNPAESVQKMQNASHFIAVRCSCPDWFLTESQKMEYKKQKYCLTVTISHETSDQIYTEVRNVIQEREHIREFR